MRELYILRHGIAFPTGTIGVPDDERPLTPKGERRMRQIGRGLCALGLGLELDLIVTSPLPRACRTAQIVAAELDLSDHLETSAVLAAGSDAQAIADWLRERNEDRLMIVGHNPAFSELVGLLLVGEVGLLAFELKKGAIAALSASPHTGHRFRLDWTAPPALLRHLSRAK
jgi:phosphohistidine phosphatase